ncbi:thyroid peroxidase [Conger conger]|uniref:thyroid peroxidase n=1 Tax=Conger conger TaxID=82655 RepID=UPI002A5AFFA2|nr:thyroid peroxidase [Conger conger]
MAPLHTTHRERRESPVQSAVPGFLFRRQADPEMLEQSRAAQRLEWTLRDLKDRVKHRATRDAKASEFPTLKEVELVMNLSGCHRPIPKNSCPTDRQSRKYRTISGVCNNRDHPSWGTANIALARWLPSEYEDAEQSPRGWSKSPLYRGFPLPLVREVSNVVMRDSGGGLVEDETYSQMLVDWGQYVAHDIAFTPQSAKQAADPAQPDCSCTCENTNLCFPIQVPPGDRLSGQRDCLPFVRSSPACPSGDGDVTSLLLDLRAGLPREQANGFTSFLDASTVYGSSSTLELRLRDLSSRFGGLDVNAHFTDRGQAHLPFVPHPPHACLSDPGGPPGERGECFLAGDSRVNEVLSLTAIHTLWVREHNRLGNALKSLNPHWSTETTYQETRKIIGALHQIITFRDYIPKVLGPEAFSQYVGTYRGYNSSVNPAVSNIFATAAFRFGHATVSAMLRRLNESFQEHELYPSLHLHQSFFSPWRLLREGGLDPVLRGMLGKPALAVTPDHLMTSELTQRLLVLSAPGSLDLTALNLQRGRDHGLAGYNDWRLFCGLERVETLAEIGSVISDPALVKKVMDLYGHPSNIDVWLGGLLEDHLPGGRTGPLFACLIGKQMKALRDGDRFWWENNGVFTQAQKRELQRHSLSRVICDGSGVREVPSDPFQKARYPHDFLSCDNIPSMNLEAWRDGASKGHTRFI